MTDVFDQKLGQKIHSYIKENHFKYSSIAKELKISRQYLYNMLMDNNPITHEYLEQINKILKTDFKL